MKHAKYVGIFTELLDKWALIRPHPYLPDYAQAQFDGPYVYLDGVEMGYGWHSFPRCAFEFEGELDDDR